MKKWLILCTVAFMLVSLSACAIFGGGSFDPEKCVIVTPASESSNKDISYAADGIKTSLRNNFGTSTKLVSDGQEKESGTCEILLGATDRDLSREAMALLPTDINDDIHAFAIVVKDGDIAIVASNSVAYKIAGKYFTTNVLANVPKELTLTKFTTEAIRREEGLNATCYEITDLYKDIFIEDVTCDGVTFDRFDALITSYDFLLGLSESIPEIKINHPSFVNSTSEWVSDEQFDITLTSFDNSKSVTYSFYFDRLEYNTVSGAKIEKVYGGKKATVVIVHDDGTHDTVNYMTQMFKMNGLVGTVGLITNKLATKSSSGQWVLDQTEVDYWKSILATGVFDVASHSHTHSFWGISDQAESGYYLDSGNKLHQYSFEAGRITEEVAGSREILKMAFPDQDVLMFIKPGFGRVSDANGTKGMTQISDKAYEIIGQNYIGMRDTDGNVTTLPLANKYKINSVVVRGSHTSSDWESQVNSAMSQNAMVVFLFHTITDNPSSTSLTGKTEETDDFFDWLGKKNDSGEIWNTFLEDAMLYSIEYTESELSAHDYGDRIELSIENALDTELYNHPLTVTVPVGADVSTVRAVDESGNSTSLEIISSGNSRFVRLDMIPDGSVITLYTE